MIDLFISTGELSGDLHGAALIEQLLAKRPGLKIGAVAGPKMRALPIEPLFAMEKLQVMGFVDVILALPKIVRQFFAIRKKILSLNPKGVVLIDYPGFHLRLERSLRKKGYKGKLIHMVCPTVWAWGKGWIPRMAETLDLLLSFFPFEKECFSHTKLPVQCVGHPLSAAVAQFQPKGTYQGQKILGLFPGSREGEIGRNLPLQMAVAQRLKKLDPTLQIEVSKATDPVEKNYELMRASHLAIATSGTVTLELALHSTPTVVNYAIRKIDCFIAQQILRLNLPYYCIANIVVNKGVFPELYGPRLTEEQLFFWAQKLWFDLDARRECIEGCKDIRKSLKINDSASVAAGSILSLVDF
ncbi:MAG TPA: hypothetical protein VLF94_00990 [Chlamydiales bacterium]|nr:hypothetical protein [Chlamydiales bacterium]